MGRISNTLLAALFTFLLSGSAIAEEPKDNRRPIGMDEVMPGQKRDGIECFDAKCGTGFQIPQIGTNGSAFSAAIDYKITPRSPKLGLELFGQFDEKGPFSLSPRLKSGDWSLYGPGLGLSAGSLFGVAGINYGPLGLHVGFDGSSAGVGYSFGPMVFSEAGVGFVNPYIFAAVHGADLISDIVVEAAKPIEGYKRREIVAGRFILNIANSIIPYRFFKGKVETGQRFFGTEGKADSSDIGELYFPDHGTLEERINTMQSLEKMDFPNIPSAGSMQARMHALELMDRTVFAPATVREHTIVDPSYDVTKTLDNMLNVLNGLPKVKNPKQPDVVKWMNSVGYLSSVLNFPYKVDRKNKEVEFQKGSFCYLLEDKGELKPILEKLLEDIAGTSQYYEKVEELLIQEGTRIFSDKNNISDAELVHFAEAYQSWRVTTLALRNIYFISEYVGVDRGKLNSLKKTVMQMLGPDMGKAVLHDAIAANLNLALFARTNTAPAYDGFMIGADEHEKEANFFYLLADSLIKNKIVESNNVQPLTERGKAGMNLYELTSQQADSEARRWLSDPEYAHTFFYEVHKNFSRLANQMRWDIRDPLHSHKYDKAFRILKSRRAKYNTRMKVAGWLYKRTSEDEEGKKDLPLMSAYIREIAKYAEIMEWGRTVKKKFHVRRFDSPI